MVLQLKRVGLAATPAPTWLAWLVPVFAWAGLTYPGYFEFHSGFAPVFNLTDLARHFPDFAWAPVAGQSYDLLRGEGTLPYLLALVPPRPGSFRRGQHQAGFCGRHACRRVGHVCLGAAPAGLLACPAGGHNLCLLASGSRYGLRAWRAGRNALAWPHALAVLGRRRGARHPITYSAWPGKPAILPASCRRAGRSRLYGRGFLDPGRPGALARRARGALHFRGRAGPPFPRPLSDAEPCKGCFAKGERISPFPPREGGRGVRFFPSHAGLAHWAGCGLARAAAASAAPWGRFAGGGHPCLRRSPGLSAPVAAGGLGIRPERSRRRRWADFPARAGRLRTGLARRRALAGGGTG